MRRLPIPINEHREAILIVESSAALLEILTKIPAGIDYFYMPPAPQWVPDVTLKKAHQNNEFFLSIVGLNNVSSKVLQSLRIKLLFKPIYEPSLDIHGTVESINATYDADKSEIAIQQLDPGEKIYVAIFLSGREAEHFTEPKVIVSDRLLSRSMRAIGFMRRRPREFLLMAAALLALVAAVFFVLFLVYNNSQLNPKVRAVDQAMQGYVGCVPTAYSQSKINDALLAKSMFGEKFLLSINHVKTREQLFKKKYVVICKAH